MRNSHNSRLRSANRLVGVAALSSALVGSALATVNVYVSPSGKDTNLGKSPATAVATLAKARDLVLTLRKYTTTEDAVIWLAPGTYFQTATTYFDGYSSNITLQSTNPSSPARISGAIQLKTGKPITDPALLARLPEAARGRAVEFDMDDYGVNVGTLKRRAANDYQWNSSGMELLFNGVPGNLARYPNNGGWMKVAPIAGQADRYATRFKLTDTRVEASAGDKNALAHGFFGNMFSDSIHPIASIDPASDVVTTSGQGPYYGMSTLGRWRLENAIAELDQPGEYYLDKDENRLIAWVPDGTTEILASTLETSLIRVTGANNLTVRNVNFAGGRLSGVVFYTGDNNRVEGCGFANLGMNGVEIWNGRNNGVASSRFVQMGEGGVWLAGGDRVSLTPAGNYVEDSTFRYWGLHLRSYRPAVKVSGVGNRVSRCTMNDSSAQAVMINGNNNVVENCDIARVAQEMGDNGAIYMGFDVTERGNVIRNNMIREVYSPKGLPTRYDENFAIYLDDLASGTTVTGNVITDSDAGLIIGGGRDNVATKNVFNNVARPVMVDGRGRTFRAEYYAPGGRFSQNVNAVNAFGPIYTAAYPELRTLLQEDYTLPRNTISNSTAQSDWIYYYDNFVKSAGACTLKGNLLGYDPRFMNPAQYDFRLRPGSPALGLGLSQLTKSAVGAMAQVGDVGVTLP